MYCVCTLSRLLVQTDDSLLFSNGRRVDAWWSQATTMPPNAIPLGSVHTRQAKALEEVNFVLTTYHPSKNEMTF